MGCSIFSSLDSGGAFSGQGRCGIGLCVLGGSWVVTSGLTSWKTKVITHIRGLVASRITTQETPPPSKLRVLG